MAEAHGETDLATLLQTLRPQVHAQSYVFCTVTPEIATKLDVLPQGMFREAEGVTLSLSVAEAERLGLATEAHWACLSLTVHSSLVAVGLTAAISQALTQAGVSANIVAAYYHDHVFVPWDKRDVALSALEALSNSAEARADVQITQLDADSTLAMLVELRMLLQDAVADGASVGFLPPLSDLEADTYWRDVAEAVRGPLRVLLVARIAGHLAGTVQLDLAGRANGLHRAEVAKLLVHTAFRRRGIGRQLMLALEERARALGRTTLVLDTRAGDPSEHLYRSLGWVPVGTIPAYARSADGQLHATALFYKLLH